MKRITTGNVHINSLVTGQIIDIFLIHILKG